MNSDVFQLDSPPVSGTDAVDTDYAINNSGNKATIQRLYLIPSVSVSTHASNYITVTVKKGANTLATHTTNSSGGTALTAGTPVELAITGTGLNLEIADGGAITVDVTKAGTGPAYALFVSAKMLAARN